jgi:hypothetical protein
MNKLDLAAQEIARYRELSQLRQDELRRTRSAIKQFCSVAAGKGQLGRSHEAMREARERFSTATARPSR